MAPRATSQLRRAAILLALAIGTVAAAGLAAPRAHAAPGVEYGLTDDAWVEDGPGTLDARLTTLHDLGVQVVRYTLDWNAIAAKQPENAADPNDPAYDWTEPDAVLDGLREHGIGVVLQLLGTPSWANGGKPPDYAPLSGSTFRDFAEAAALRYPWVMRWLIWNEPNQVRWLRPTSARVYTTRLVNPGFDAIHGVIPGAQVGGGATASRGATGGVSPVAWIAGMHAAHARLDAYAQNPYPLNPKVETPLEGGCDHCTTITMATLSRLVTLVKRDFGSARIWLSEYGYQTNPPDRILGVSPVLQARYIGEGAYQAYRTPRVDLLIHYLYRDEPQLARFQSGLVKLSNAKKPGYAAFELPLVETSRKGAAVSLWGQLRAPGTNGSASLERRRNSGSVWSTVATAQATTDGYFSFHVRLPKGTWARVVSGAVVGGEILLE